MSNNYRFRSVYVGHVFGLVFAMLVLGGISASAQVAPERVADFDGKVPFSPYIGGGVIKDADGTFYGTTYDSINTRCGTAYKILANGTLTVLHEFTGHSTTPPDGCHPMGELVEGADGNLYGTTTSGGANADLTFTSGTGTIFKVSKQGDSAFYQVVHSFAGYDPILGYWPEGAGPIGGLVIAGDNNFYGTTSFGGAGSVGGGNCTSLGGTVFRLSPSDATGTPTVVHALSFAEGCAPTQLALASDGSLLGTTIQGGDAGGDVSLGGTIFRVTTSGSFTRLAVFPGTIASGTPYGYGPYAPPVEDPGDGTLYGTTTSGGPAAGGNESGTVYKCVPAGSACTLQLVHPFTYSDGGYTFAGLTLGKDGTFYGATSAGGAYTNGVLFQVTRAGAFNNLFSFNPSDSSFNGASAYARLLETSPGTFYGTTYAGGSSSRPGTVFRFSTCAVDISATVGVSGQGQVKLNRKTGHYTQAVVLKNGDGPVSGPVSLVLDNLSTNATLVGVVGTTSCTTPTGSPYVNVDIGTDGIFSPRERVTVTLEFDNPSGQPISYTTRILAGSGIR